MRTVLLSPPYLPFYMRNARCDFVSLSGTQWYPILLALCGAWLEKCGHTVEIIDAPTYHLTKQQTTEIVRNFQPEWIVLYSGRLSESSDLAYANELTEQLHCQCVIVGPYASIQPEQTLRAAGNIPYLVVGEFEHAVEKLIGGTPPAQVPNLLYRQGDNVLASSVKAALTAHDLEQIPFASEFISRKLDIRRYRALSEPYPFMDIMMGRGCAWGRCTYCLWVHSYKTGPSYVARSVESVIDELRFITAHLPSVRSVMLQDDTLPEERASAFAEAKMRANNRLPWSCYTRASFSFETLAAMKRSGCHNLHVGFESGSNAVLKKIKKGLTVDIMKTFAANAKRAGLQIHGDFAIGFPGETEQDIQSTVDLACALRPESAQFQLLIPFPCTPFYKELAANGWLQDGLPNYPSLSRERMEQLARKAYLRYYVSWPYLFQVLKNPKDLIFGRLGVYFRALPFLIGRRYIR